MNREDETRELEALGIPHPSPLRDRFSLWILLLPLLVPPLLWTVQLALGYALVATACFPHHAPRVGELPLSNTSWVIAATVSLLSMAVMAGLGILALRIWKRGGGEHDQPRGLLLDIGEGRTSFLAHWGIFVGFGFLFVTVFDSLPLLFVPFCGN